jgi:hypothetical protein
MYAVEAFIQSFEGAQYDLLGFFHDYLLSLNLQPKMRYKLPFYDGKSWIIFLNPTAHNTVHLGFIRGNEIEDIYGILEVKKRKQVRTIEFINLSDLEKEGWRETIMMAIDLDNRVKYSSIKTQKSRM